MIKGSINIYEEKLAQPTTYILGSNDEDEYWYQNYLGWNRPPVSPEVFQKELEATIADAMANKFFIGTKVRRKPGANTIHDTGTILHFKKDMSAWKSYKNRVECLTIKWDMGNYTSDWHQDELEIIK